MNDGLFRCNLCPGTFSDEIVLKSHHEYLHQKLQCKLCGSELYGNGIILIFLLLRYWLSNARKISSFTIAGQGQLFFHLKEAHEPFIEMSVEGGLSYVCPICPDSDNFSGHDSYLDHYAKTHVSMEVASHPANKAASSAIVLLCQRTFGFFSENCHCCHYHYDDRPWLPVDVLPLLYPPCSEPAEHAAPHRNRASSERK